MRPSRPHVVIVGAGIGGLTLALELHDAGIDCQVYEAVPAVTPIGVGINVLPHATAVLARLGLTTPLAEAGVTTRESVFYNRFGQLVYREPAGRYAGYDSPQFSLHRGDLQRVLLDAVRDRLGPAAVRLGHRCTRVTQDDDGVRVSFRGVPGDEALPDVRGDALVGCDGIHSVIRRQLHPGEGEPVYSGVNMWRGVTRWPSFLSGASMVRAGWLASGKMVIYPIRDAVDEAGNQLVNWVAELETPHHQRRDWNRVGNLDDFADAFADWHFDWLDVPALLHASEEVLEYPMVDQEPLDHWTLGRITLLGDAAHPMVPRGSNGAGQAILDAHALREELHRTDDVGAALKAYESRRLPATARVVRTNRSHPPDAILREVFTRTGDRPFARIENVISVAELAAISNRYREVTGHPTATR
ncbi:flavin-dependent oxidoreductase [Plantactinospora soyae]|uniref:2-polyprenyl-6-methoxyphenol hydroxylase-like FAD-dependent oxidoreductase n=1 Tax=Plantactinospora soyae TaxID=1544732 RepID=A0A927MCB2_9ACTN|nr:flavin-dependent oxidoreductase [Plantactinospora soyae]MBE1491854.1 2-polyprenyl-6-methoxyphenol hydroxylase-like FAD-dependent oxidoreductase [Plantactinospora soyae]